ncbi:MAG: DUF445 family protein [Rhizobiaceae bacterium]|nr:DUF445 family protein [Rhizobiaceae bacterium]
MVQGLGPEEHEKLQQLKRVKRLATLVLALCFLVMVFAMTLETRYPALGFVAAFAEAATIGGIADWYAVVALFKHPMNLPFPHTAIIPNNQHRIGDNIGRFIENNFLASDPIREKLEEVDFAEEIAQWLSERSKSHSLAEFSTRLVPQMLHAVDQKGLVDFASDKIRTELEKTNLAPLVGEVMDTLANDRRQQQLMNELLTAIHRFLTDEEALESIRKKVSDELPALLNLFRADRMLMNRIIKAASALLEEIKENPDHELRAEFERFLKEYVIRLKRSKRFANRVELMKKQVLNRPEFKEIAQHTWGNIRTFLEEDVRSANPKLTSRLTDILIDAGENLKSEPKLRQEINDGMVTFLSGFVESQKENISIFVSDQVKSWDFRQLTLLIEANIGKDLQYIRFNGMLIGGLVGLVLHILQLTLPNII